MNNSRKSRAESELRKKSGFINDCFLRITGSEQLISYSNEDNSKSGILLQTI